VLKSAHLVAATTDSSSGSPVSETAAVNQYVTTVIVTRYLDMVLGQGQNVSVWTKAIFCLSAHTNTWFS